LKRNRHGFAGSVQFGNGNERSSKKRIWALNNIELN
jgi:hypothetical protein